MSHTVDILAFAAHPDDIELSCGGTIVKQATQGDKIAIVDLTAGELGTRGTAAIRATEAKKSAKILGVVERENLGLPDGFFDLSEKNKLAVVKMIRKYKPTIVLANSVTDRHPDHARAAQLVSEACFLAGLVKIETSLGGKKQEAHRPDVVYHYIQDHYIKPDVIVDITGYFDIKMDAIKAFKSQFYDPNSKEPSTPISSPEFIKFLEARSREYGRLIKTEYGEGFTVERPAGVENLNDLI